VHPTPRLTPRPLPGPLAVSTAGVGSWRGGQRRALGAGLSGSSTATEGTGVFQMAFRVFEKLRLGRLAAEAVALAVLADPFLILTWK
jgi:hypothetical protein